MANWSELTRQLVRDAVQEDLGERGDITAALLQYPQRRVIARLTARAPGVFGGATLAPEICSVFAQQLGADLSFDAQIDDGARVAAGAVCATVSGPVAAVLTLERTLLNFLTRLSGVATQTRLHVDAAQAANPAVQVLDTRKTLPGWRELDKYAVRLGGGVNHRLGLFDAVLIKDNHLAGVSTSQLAETIERLIDRVHGPVAFVAVEVDTLAQLAEVARVPRVGIVLLDNFTRDDMRSAVAQRDDLRRESKLLLEVSGGVRLDNIGAIAATGVDRISVGALTHSAPALDLALDM